MLLHRTQTLNNPHTNRTQSNNTRMRLLQRMDVPTAYYDNDGKPKYGIL